MYWPPLTTKRIPAVLTKDELAGLLAQLDGVTARVARPALWIHCFRSEQTSQPHRYPPPRHMLLSLSNRKFTIVKNARRQHRIRAAGLYAVGQMV